MVAIEALDYSLDNKNKNERLAILKFTICINNLPITFNSLIKTTIQDLRKVHPEQQQPNH